MTIVAGSVPASAYPRPGRTARMSVATDGGGGNAGSTLSSSPQGLTAEGRYLVFHSEASNLVAGDTNETWDVFVRDRETGATDRLSVSSEGIEGNGWSFSPSITPDGRYVFFWSAASTLVAGDTNRVTDIFVRDREMGTTERISVSSDGTYADADSYFPTTSADGRYVTFQTRASNLVPGDTNRSQDILVHDRQTGTTERVSVASDVTESDDGSFAPSISAHGRYVAFHSAASNLVPDDTNDFWDIFVHDRDSGTTERVSVTSDGGQANGGSDEPSISADGRYVAFRSWASNFVLDDTYGSYDVFVRDLKTGITERVSVSSKGEPGNFTSMFPSISDDGRYVGFRSFAGNLVPGDTNGNKDVFEGADIFVRDRKLGITERVSVADDGSEGNGESLVAPSLSKDARYVAFATYASNLVPGDSNDAEDVFLRDRGPAVGVGGVSAVPQGDRISVSGWATFSGQVTSVPDPPGDGAAGAEPAGAELTGASLAYRPADEDLLVSLRLASLPGLPAGAVGGVGGGTGAGAEGILYGLEFGLDGTRYEVRASRSVMASPLGAPYFALYRCDPGCSEQTPLSGGIGTTGAEVLVSVPLSALGVSPEGALQEVRAFTAVGDGDLGPVMTLDEAELPDTTVPASLVSIGIAPADTPEDGVSFDAAVQLADGDFSGSLDVSSLASGDFEVWGRACLGENCGSASTPVTVGGAVEKKDTILELTVEGRGQDMVLEARLTEVDAPQRPIEERTIDFYSDGELIGSGVTDAEGIATVTIPPAHRGANRTYEAVFAGDNLFMGSSDERPGQGGEQGDGEGSFAEPGRRYASGGVFLL